MFSKNHQLPRLLVEDYMAILRGLVLFAAVAIGLAMLTQFSVKAWAKEYWPEGGLALVYNLVVLEFAAVTTVLAGLVFFSNWIEREPRYAAQRVRKLLIFTIGWFSLHLFAAFHLTGGFGGPLMPLMPVLLIAALTVFPGISGWLVAGYLMFGHMCVRWLEEFGLLGTNGGIGQLFSLTPPLSNWSLASLACVLFLCLLLAATLRRWMFPAFLSISPAQRVDPSTGLFRRVFLEHCMKKEFKRIKSQGGSVALLLIGRHKKDKGQIKKEMTNAIIEQIRIGSDTPATYRPGVIAVLLPDADPMALRSLSWRIVEAVTKAGGSREMMRSAIAVADSRSDSPAELKAQAEAAFREAEQGEAPMLAAAA